MLPYFAALDQIHSVDIPMGQQVGVLFFYNLVFIIPLASMIVLRFASEDLSAQVFGGITRFFSTRGKRVLVVLLSILGAVLIADAIGFYLGFPILPI
jgi:predicted small integral membrane protein